VTGGARVVVLVAVAFFGTGEEQNAVLARAVIGGVAVGTMTTLLFVPYLYSVIGLFERQEKRDTPKTKHLAGLSHQGSSS